jgi:hypothetical protein
MIKLINILKENKILIPRRSPEEREKNFLSSTQKIIQQYIKNGSKGDLDLNSTPITSLPDNLTTVGRDLILYYTKITSLPDNLTVGRDLNLFELPIKSLPSGLKVKGELDLRETLMDTLPPDLLAKKIIIGSSPLSKKSNDEIKKMAPGVKEIIRSERF